VSTEFYADDTFFSLQMSTVTNIRLHLFLKYFEEISRFLKTLMDTEKAGWNLLSIRLLT